MKIRICNTGSGLPFPYGQLTKEEREFIKTFEGEEFTAERTCMNYYRLVNGMNVHIYNGTEVKERPAVAPDQNPAIIAPQVN